MIATLERTSYYVNGILDLSIWLEPGVKYDHMTLKRIYYQVGDLGLNCQEGDPNWRIGKAFFDAIYQWWEAGHIEMSQSVLQGEPCDFWMAVFMARHHESKGFKVVEGYLMITSVPDGFGGYSL